MKQGCGIFVLIGSLIAAVMQLTAAKVLSCGVEWSKPLDHFDGVNEYGYVSYWDQIGTLDLGAGLTLPLIIGFQSDREWSSPYLGSGWILALLDSHITQRSENAFDMVQPDGYTVPFGRDSKNPAVLGGAKGWKAEIRGNWIIAYAECGWKLSFYKGTIASLTTPRNETIEIQRDLEGVATAVVRGTTVYMKVQRDASKGTTDLVLGDTSIRLEQITRPLIESVNGRNVIKATKRAVGTVTVTNGQVKRFDYSPSAGLQPRIAISNRGGDTRVITWNSVDRTIVSDGPWKYSIRLPDIAGHNAAIGRTNAKNQREGWHYDLAKGEERVETLNGEVSTTRWFTSGALNGKLRSVQVQDVKGLTRALTSYSYNENGDLIRKVGPSDSFVRKYDYASRTVDTFTLSGDLLHREMYDDQKRLVETRYVDGKVERFSYVGNKAVKTIDLIDGRTVEIVIADGKVESFKTIVKESLQSLQQNTRGINNLIPTLK